MRHHRKSPANPNLMWETVDPRAQTPNLLGKRLQPATRHAEKEINPSQVTRYLMRHRLEDNPAKEGNPPDRDLVARTRDTWHVESHPLKLYRQCHVPADLHGRLPDLHGKPPDLNQGSLDEHHLRRETKARQQRHTGEAEKTVGLWLSPRRRRRCEETAKEPLKKNRKRK